MTKSTGSRMPLVATLEVIRRLRTDQIVVTTMGAAREWPKLSQHPLDFHYVPSSMGQAPPLGLGLALAKPQREVLVLNGDGGMLMNLGCLVTIVASGARNITVIVIENGIFEVTGGQQTPAPHRGSSQGFPKHDAGSAPAIRLRRFAFRQDDLRER